MAFGDIIQTQTATSEDTTSLSISITSATADNLLVCCHFTGDGDSTAPSGFTESVFRTNTPDQDQGAIYHKIAAGGETSVAPGSGASDEHVGCVMEIEGPWDASPLDVTAATGRNNNVTSTSSGTTATTAQNDEFAVAQICLRDSVTVVSSWTNSFVERSEINTATKASASATKLLTATGTVETTGSHSTADSLGMVATFKKGAAAAALLPRSTHISQAVQRAANW